jgi:succinate dehydrogenase/fumarate reductase flavoprotein subunit
MQVLDKNERVIPGLYAVGTIVGDMYSNIYTFLAPGHNLGATCVTFGYLVGKDIAREGKESL